MKFKPAKIGFHGLVFVVSLGLSLLANRYDFSTHFQYNHLVPCYVTISVPVQEENADTMQLQLYHEIRKTVVKNNLYAEIAIDTVQSKIIMYRKNSAFVYFTDWCLFIADQSFARIATKRNSQKKLQYTIYCTCPTYFD